MKNLSYLSLCFAALSFVSSHTAYALPAQSENLVSFNQAESLTKQARQLLTQDNFAALDSLANEARTSKARFADGEWKLFILYQALTLPTSGTTAGEMDWEPHLARLQRWHKTSSKSVTAHITYGAALIEYALKAHVGGQEWNSMGTEIGGRAFQARLKSGLTVLQGLKKVKDHCPHLYYIQLRLAMAQGWSWNEFNLPYAEGIAQEPSYHYFYQAKAFNFLPRNRGGQGEWENYADEVYRQLGAQEGALAYFMIVSHLRPTLGASLFSKNRAYLSRLKEGYQVLLSRYQGNNLRHNEMAYFASLARDQVTAKAAFDRIGNARNTEVWASQAFFEQKRAWAFELSPKAMSKAQVIR